MKENEEYIEVRYERLVENVSYELNRIIDFLQLKDIAELLQYAKQCISNRYVGFYKEHLSTNDLQNISYIIKPYLQKLGYT